MSLRRGLVLDANIILRAVFGVRVRDILDTYEEVAAFYTPDTCLEETQKYIPTLAERRKFPADLALSVLAQLTHLIQPVDKSLYQDFESVARERIAPRDPEDWPVVATALLLEVPIWTEDQDFFGSGIATWTTDRVELYLRE